MGSTRWLQRKMSFRGVQGNVADAQTPTMAALLWHFILPRTTMKVDKVTQQTVTLSTGTVTLGLPAGYSNSDYLCFFIKTNAKIKVTMTSPVNGAQATIVEGSALVPGIFMLCEKVTSIVLKYQSATATVEFFAFQLPDLTVSSNFKGVAG